MTGRRCARAARPLLRTHGAPSCRRPARRTARNPPRSPRPPHRPSARRRRCPGECRGTGPARPEAFGGPLCRFACPGRFLTRMARAAALLSPRGSRRTSPKLTRPAAAPGSSRAGPRTFLPGHRWTAMPQEQARRPADIPARPPLNGRAAAPARGPGTTSDPAGRDPAMPGRGTAEPARRPTVIPGPGGPDRGAFEPPPKTVAPGQRPPAPPVLRSVPGLAAAASPSRDQSSTPPPVLRDVSKTPATAEPRPRAGVEAKTEPKSAATAEPKSPVTAESKSPATAEPSRPNLR